MSLYRTAPPILTIPQSKQRFSMETGHGAFRLLITELLPIAA